MKRPHPDDALSRSHPFVAFLFFGLAIGSAMVFLHPVLTPISLLAAIAYSTYLGGAAAVRFHVLAMVPLLIAAAVFNPLFSHAGVTTLFYLFDGNPVTLESITYGGAAAAMLVTVIVWFSCSNRVLTSDKIIYLFGRAIPALSLLFSMALRFVPRLKFQLVNISYAQRGMGQGVTSGGLLARLRAGARLFSILATWALENSIESADSMKSRGYGLPGRTAFSTFRFDRRDRATLAVLLVTTGLLGIGTALHLTSMSFYPALEMPPVDLASVIVWLSYAGLLATPLVLNVIEEVQWRRIASAA